MKYYTILILLAGCSFVQEKQPAKEKKKSPVKEQQEIQLQSQHVKEDEGKKEVTSPLEQRLKSAGLVNVQELDSTIRINIRYSTTDNFLGKDVYEDFDKAYLQPEVAEKLVLAQLFLRSQYPKYSLLIYDAVRPRSIQQKMWEFLDMPLKEKVKYLSNPRYGSLHNYGAAVDLTITDEYGEELDMGTDFDHFGELAYPTKEEEMLKQGKLTKEQVNNRKLLREVMGKAGFFNIQTEWWHFNSCYRKEAAQKYAIVE